MKKFFLVKGPVDARTEAAQAFAEMAQETIMPKPIIPLTPTPKPEPPPSLSLSQYRMQMMGFQIGAFGGGSDEKLEKDPYYKSGYLDGQARRKQYSETLKERMETAQPLEVDREDSE